MNFLVNLHVLLQFFLLLLKVPHVLQLLLVLFGVPHPVANVFYLVAFQLQLFKVFKRGIISHTKLNVNNV